MAEIHKNNLPKGLVDSMRKFLETSKPIITEDERVRNERAQALVDKRAGKSPTVLTEASDPAKAGRIAAGYKGSSPAEQGSIAASKEGAPFSGGHNATNKDGHKVARKLARTAKKKEMAPEKETGVDADRENAAKNDPKKSKAMGLKEAEEKKESTGVKVGDRVWLRKEHLEKQKAPLHLAHKNFKVFHVHGDGRVNIKHLDAKHGPYTVPAAAVTRVSPHTNKDGLASRSARRAASSPAPEKKD
jgi:hypothetical protein